MSARTALLAACLALLLVCAIGARHYPDADPADHLQAWPTAAVQNTHSRMLLKDVHKEPKEPKDPKDSGSAAHMELVEKANEEAAAAKAAEDAKKKDGGKKEAPKKVSAQDKP